jgi:renierapurpurin 18,18'-hydroxylase
MTETPRAKPVHAEAVGSGLTSDLRTIGAHPDYWYPAAWSRELKADRSYTARFAGEPIVLVRPAGGPVFALEDRCAHRQVPLSKGVVDGCGIRCCYHGWRYDGSGRCIDVPYLGKGKLPNGVRSYPCFERDGIIFVCRGWRPRPNRRSASAPPHAGSENWFSATTPSCTKT